MEVEVDLMQEERSDEERDAMGGTMQMQLLWCGCVHLPRNTLLPLHLSLSTSPSPQLRQHVLKSDRCAWNAKSPFSELGEV